jgi:outer membrane lipoprotein-sorting protein
MALQRALRRVFALGVTLCVLASAVDATGLGRLGAEPSVPTASARQERSTQPGDLFDEIYRRGAPIESTLRTVSASFIETTTSTLLKAPQVSRGTLVARRPSDVRLQYGGDDPRTVAISGNTLAVDWPKRGLRDRRDISGTMRRAQRFFTATSPAELRKQFDIVATVATDRPRTWTVHFTPRRKQLREGVAAVRLWIDQQTLLLHAMRLEFPGGDTTLMEFADVRVNPPVDADAFALAPR